jgi:hypothetical protein
MKKVLLLSVLLCLYLFPKAQKVYFIYLQSETAAPFYVRMADKIMSSTAEGYLILPQLRDSVYLISIGQPGKSIEPKFTVTVSRGDRGFLIKNVEGTFGLFDLQTMALYKPIVTETVTTPGVPRTDNFTKLLSKAADDTTVLNQAVVVEQPKAKPKETKPEQVAVKEKVASPDTMQTSSAVVKNTSTVAVTTPKEAVAQNETKTPIKDTVAKKDQEVEAVQADYTKSVVVKKTEASSSEGLGLTFLDTYNGATDTIQIVIPNPKTNLTETTQKQPTETKQFLEITNEKDSTNKQTEIVKNQEPAPVASQKAVCNSLSTDDDFFRLRTDMITKRNDDEMIAQAKKYFKTKCYRTEQIKYLSNLFLTDEGKYQLFDAAFMHVSDQEKFASLQLLIKDAYYLNRFKALIGN